MLKDVLKRYYYLIPSIMFLLIYSQSVFYGAVWGDDPMVISPQAKDFHLMLKSFYDTSQYSGVHYLPMYYLQYFLVNKIFGAGAYPFGFHLYHLLVQSLVCIFATLVFHSITKNKLFSVMVVAFWIMHPVNVQMSTRVLVGAGVMGFAFCLCFIYFNLKVVENDTFTYKWIYITLANLFFLIALMSVESYFFFPVLLYLMSYYLKGTGLFNRKYWYLSIPIFFTIPLYLSLRFLASDGNIFNTSVSNELMSWTDIGGIKGMLLRAIWLSPQLIVHYFKLFFWPFGLMDSKAEWYMVGGSLFSPYSLFCQTLVLCLILSVGFMYKKNPLYSVGISWFFISIVLFIQIFPLFTIVGVRYLYAPGLGLMFALLSFIFSCSRTSFRKCLIVLSIPIFLFLLTRTIYYLPSSKDLLSQWIYCAKEAPLWNKPTYYARALDIGWTEHREKELPQWLNENAFGKLIGEWLSAYLDLKPSLSTKYGPMQMAYNFYAFRGIFKFLYYSGQYEKLSKALNTAVGVNDGWLGWYEVAKFLKDSNQWKDSWHALKTAIKKSPGFKHSYDLRFIEIAIKSNNVSEAERIIKNYISLNPAYSYPHLFIGYFYMQLGRTEDALSNFREAVQDDRRVSVREDFLYITAAKYFIQNKYHGDAVKSLNSLLSYNPFNEEARDLLNSINSADLTTN